MEIAVGDTEKKPPSEDIGKMGGDVSHKSHDSTVINMELTAMEEEECIEEEVESNDPSDVDDMLMEDGEDKEWFPKVKFAMTPKHKKRLEAKGHTAYATSYQKARAHSTASPANRSPLEDLEQKMRKVQGQQIVTPPPLRRRYPGPGGCHGYPGPGRRDTRLRRAEKRSERARPTGARLGCGAAALAAPPGGTLRAHRGLRASQRRQPGAPWPGGRGRVSRRCPCREARPARGPASARGGGALGGWIRQRLRHVTGAGGLVRGFDVLRYLQGFRYLPEHLLFGQLNLLVRVFVYYTTAVFFLGLCPV
ncbi:unnamed protein product [Caretta caretta]